MSSKQSSANKSGLGGGGGSSTVVNSSYANTAGKQSNASGQATTVNEEYGQFPEHGLVVEQQRRKSTSAYRNSSTSQQRGLDRNQKHTGSSVGNNQISSKPPI